MDLRMERVNLALTFAAQEARRLLGADCKHVVAVIPNGRVFDIYVAEIPTQDNRYAYEKEKARNVAIGHVSDVIVSLFQVAVATNESANNSPLVFLHGEDENKPCWRLVDSVTRLPVSVDGNEVIRAY